MFINALSIALLSAASINAQDVSVCGSQIYTPGTGTCYVTPAGTQQLCLYQTNTAGQQVVTFLCGTVCYDAGKYVCRNNVLTDQTGVASLASARSTAAPSALATTQQGTATSAAPIASGSLIASQSRVASSAAAAGAAGGSGSSRVTSSGAAASSSAAARSSADQKRSVNKSLGAGAFVGLAGVFACGLML